MAGQHTHTVHLRHHRHRPVVTRRKGSNQISDTILLPRLNHSILHKVGLSLSTLFHHHSKGKRQHNQEEERHLTQTRVPMICTPHHLPEPMPTTQEDRPLLLIHGRPLRVVEEVLKNWPLELLIAQ